MILRSLEHLAELIHEKRTELLDEWRKNVRQLPSAHDLAVPTLDDHIPAVLNVLILALRKSKEANIGSRYDGLPTAHGVQRVADGFDISEVVAEYNIMRTCILRLADSHGLNMQGPPLHVLNEIIDTSIGSAVRSFAERQAREVQLRREEHLTFIAHDLRTPLSAILLASQILDRQFPEDSNTLDMRRTLKSLRRNTRYLANLVAKVVDEGSRLETEGGIKIQEREIDLWPMVEGVIQDLSNLAAAEKTILVNRVQDDLVILADAHLLRRVFQNLIANAIRHTFNGTVTIGARDVEAGSVKNQQASARDADSASLIQRDHHNPKVENSQPSSHNFPRGEPDKIHSPLNIECWVSDTGSGIPESQIEKIFEKGETDSDIKQGAGLGLAIVKTFIEAHGSVISVDSSVGRGSTFRFVLRSRGNENRSG